MKDRTDPHRPSVMDPSEYVYVGAADDHPGDSYLEIRHDVLARHGVETGISDRYSSTNVPFYDATEDGRPNYRCHHCGKHGSNIRYFVFFLHKPTRQVIVVGQICAKKLNLGSKDELDLQKRADEFRRMQARHQWVDTHPDEYAYLKSYAEQADTEHAWYSEFFESLWNMVQHRGSLSDAQVNGLHKWMERGKPWQRDTIDEPIHASDGDRHQGEVTRTQDAPTEKQIEFIQQLHRDLGRPPYVVGSLTRLEASDLINALKALLARDRESSATDERPATERQISYINALMDNRVIPSEKRQEARRQLDAGLTKSQASRWIEALKTLPEIGDK